MGDSQVPSGPPSIPTPAPFSGLRLPEGHAPRPSGHPPRVASAPSAPTSAGSWAQTPLPRPWAAPQSPHPLSIQRCQLVMCGHQKHLQKLPSHNHGRLAPARLLQETAAWALRPAFPRAPPAPPCRAMFLKSHLEDLASLPTAPMASIADQVTRDSSGRGGQSGSLCQGASSSPPSVLGSGPSTARFQRP